MKPKDADAKEAPEKVFFSVNDYKGTNHLNIFVGRGAKADAIKAAKKFMAKGHTVVWNDGRKEWINSSPAHDSLGWIFDEGSERVRMLRSHTVIDKSGQRTVTELRPSWRKWDGE